MPDPGSPWERENPADGRGYIAQTLERPKTHYAATEIGGQVYVVDQDDVRVAQIPLLPNPSAPSLRSVEERWSIAQQLARMLNEESERCHA